MSKVVVTLTVLGFIFSSCGDGAEPGSAGESTTTLADTTTTRSAPSDVTTTTPVPSSAAIDPGPLRCKTVGFTPNSEDAASDVMATGLSCADAEAFVRVAGERTSSGGPQELDVSGYHCVRTRSEQDPLPQAFYECTNGPKKVTFVRS
jgi:hypothetical protein